MWRVRRQVEGLIGVWVRSGAELRLEVEIKVARLERLDV